MATNALSHIFCNDADAEVMDRAQFRSAINTIASMYDRLHCDYEKLQAKFDIQMSQRSPEACVPGSMRLDVKAPRRPCTIASTSESDNQIDDEADRSVEEIHSYQIPGDMSVRKANPEEAELIAADGTDASIANFAKADLPTTNMLAQSSLPKIKHFKRSYSERLLKKSLSSNLDRAAQLLHEIPNITQRIDSSPTSRYRHGLFENLLESQFYEIFMSCAIILNVVLLIAETDHTVSCASHGEGTECIPSWMVYVNMILLGVYTIEMIIVIDVYRCGIFHRPMRLLEAFIVLSGIFDFIMFYLFRSNVLNVTMLKLVRLMRLVRGARLISMSRELNSIIVGFGSAMRTMLWGFVTLMLFIVTLSLVAVELFHPVVPEVGRQECTEAFGSVWNAVLFFFQTIVAGDSWGFCSLPLIKLYPILFVFLAFSLLSVQTGILNLIISVTMDRVAAALEGQREKRLQERQKETDKTRKKWFDLFHVLDTDGSSDLSLSELLEGFDTLPDFNLDLQLLGVEKEDLPFLLTLMDQDGDNFVSLDELLFMFDMITHYDSKMYQITTGMQTRVIGQRLEHMLHKLQSQISQISVPVNA